MSLSSKSDKEYPSTPTIPSERIKTLLEMINKNFDSSTNQTAPSETKKVVQTQVDISLNDEDKSISSSNHTHQSINFISSLSKLDPKETKSVVHFSQKPKSKRVCSSNNKTEITINLITLDNNEISHKILNDNYHYLTQTFNDEIDIYSSIHNNVKAYLTEEKINEYLKKKVNSKHTLSFGDEPIKIYKDVLYDKLTCIGRVQHHAKDSGDNIQDVLCTLPVLKAPESAFVNLSRSYYPCYMFSQAQISRMKNKKLNATTSNAVHRHNNNNHIGVNEHDDNDNDSSSFNKKMCSCCMEAKKYGKECHCNCNIKIKNDINNNNNNNNNILGGSSDEDKHYNCNFCSCKFTSPQGLGGHMSRTHKSQSLKFLKKKEIRNNREPQRKLLEEAKRILCENHKRDYYMLLKSKQGKEIIKQLILNHQKEFKLIRKQLDNHNNNNNNNNNINTFNVNINSNKHCNGQTNKLIDIGNKELSVEEE